MISDPEIINKILKDKRLKEYQKRLIIDGFNKKVIDSRKFLDLYFPANVDEFVTGLEYFPQSVLNLVSMSFIDRELEMKINSLRHSNRYHDRLYPYFEHCISSPEKRYEHVLNSISDLWKDSDKDPSIFLTSKNFEAILQNLPGYRDHFIHSFYVFLLGYYTINRLSEIANFNIQEYLRLKDPNLT